jgi:hypothetical protein
LGVHKNGLFIFDQMTLYHKKLSFTSSFKGLL